MKTQLTELIWFNPAAPAGTTTLLRPTLLITKRERRAMCTYHTNNLQNIEKFLKETGYQKQLQFA